MSFKQCLGVLILLGVAVFFAACKGKQGPAGPNGTPYTPPAPFCASPSSKGVTTVGASFGDTGGYLMANPVTLATAATAVSISINIGSGPATGQVRMGIYTDNANAPANLVIQGNPQNVVADSWNTIALPSTYLPAGTYWMTLLFSNTTEGSYTSGVGTEYSISYGWAILPLIFPASSSSAFRESMYISVCP